MCYTWKLAGESSLLGSQKLSVFHNKTTTTTTTLAALSLALPCCFVFYFSRKGWQPWRGSTIFLSPQIRATVTSLLGSQKLSVFHNKTTTTLAALSLALPCCFVFYFSRKGWQPWRGSTIFLSPQIRATVTSNG